MPDYIWDAETPWNAAFTETSPLVLDLTSTHGGIALTSFNASTTTTFFDIDNSGFATQTAWVGEDMGLLCRDLNDNGKIDNAGELFGSPTVDGFALLSTLDSNGDHRIDQYDSAWSTLKIWVDANGDAVTQDGELHTLGDLNVKSVDLAAVASSTSTINGNPISHTSFFTFDDGSAATIADAWFVHDKVNSYYNGDYTLDVDTLFLPTLRGFGTLPDLTIAMSIDSTLKGMVDDFTSGFDPTISFADGAALDASITDILYQWAGVEGVDPGSRGPNVDAQHLAFLEQFFGQPYHQLIYGSQNPFYFAGSELEQAWQQVFVYTKAELLAQTGADIIYGGTISYNPYTGDFDGDKTISQDAIDALQAAAPTDTTEHTQHYWDQVAEFIAVTKGLQNLTYAENTMMDDAITATDATLSWDAIQRDTPLFLFTPGSSPFDDTIFGTSGNDSLDGAAGNDIITGNGGHDTLHGGIGDDVVTNNGSDVSTLYGDQGNDTLYGGSGGDTLYGNDGNDTITGGSGNDTFYGGDGSDHLFGAGGNDILDPGTGGNFVYGGAGDDTYVFAAGYDVYDEYLYSGSGTDTILLPDGIDSGDLDLVGSVNGSNYLSLLITVGDLGTIQIDNFASSSVLSGIETITFHDTSTLDLSDFTALTIYGSSGDDFITSIYTSQYIDSMIYAGSGNDTISLYGGNNTIDGGAGSDTITASSGDDTYIASPGFDSISDTGGSDVIQMPEGITADNVHLLRHSDAPYDLEITVDGLGQIHIGTQFYDPQYQIEQIVFSDSSTINLTTHAIETVGTSGNDDFYGVSGYDNIMDGRAGSDTLRGLGGDDTYIASPGLDTIVESGSGGDDTLHYGSGVNFEDLTFSQPVSTYDLNIVLHASADEITILQQLSGNSNYVLENLTFADGFHLDLSDWSNWQSVSGAYSAGNGGETDIGSSGVDTITGGTGDDAIVGMGGNDTLHGGDGADQLRGGDGTDTLYGDAGNDLLWGNAGADTLSGGNGSDTISGGDGADALTGGSGADIFVFRQGETGSDTISDFSTGDADKIDIHDLLTGYDPLTSTITDFVHFTASGGNAVVSVDMDGAAGGAANFVQIATLTGQSALAGTEADLLANGYLLAQAA